MNRALSRIWPLGLAVVLVALPLLGPAIDHHFAERQPYHAHMGADSWHDHDYRAVHAHSVERDGGDTFVLYSFEVSSPVSSVAILTGTDLAERLAPDPDSALAMPESPEAALVSALVPIPKRPPRA